MALSDRPENSPRPGLWRGSLETSAQPGYFDPIHFAPYIEINASGPVLRKSSKVNRSGTLSANDDHSNTMNFLVYFPVELACSFEEIFYRLLS